jgi:hypothetical protein
MSELSKVHAVAAALNDCGDGERADHGTDTWIHNLSEPVNMSRVSQAAQLPKAPSSQALQWLNGRGWNAEEQRFIRCVRLYACCTCW